jgi:hypothetical protein
MENVNYFQKVQAREANLFLPKQEETEEQAANACPPHSSFGKVFASTGKKALFFTSVPFYWLVFFTKILNFFDMRFFVFVVVATIALTLMGKNWGLLNILLK